MFDVKIISDHVSYHGARITTMQLAYPRFIHSEFMTHRVFSRSASSSRAIPVAKMLEQVASDPAMPVHWGANRPGMQAREQLQAEKLQAAKQVWLQAAKTAAEHAKQLSELGLHKQVANRILEPFQRMHTVVTSTDWSNFFALRCHPDAQPEIQKLACMMRDALKESEPILTKLGQWHLPYITKEEQEELKHSKVDLRKVSAARCARVSYRKHDGSKAEIEDDLLLFEKLAGSDPMHASPLEHQAAPMHNPLSASRNFRGWLQFREVFENMKRSN